MENNNQFEITYVRFLVFMMALSVFLFILGYALSSSVVQEFTRYCLVVFVASLCIPLFEKSQSS